MVVNEIEMIISSVFNDAGIRKAMSRVQRLSQQFDKLTATPQAFNGIEVGDNGSFRNVMTGQFAGYEEAADALQEYNTVAERTGRGLTTISAAVDDTAKRFGDFGAGLEFDKTIPEIGNRFQETFKVIDEEVTHGKRVMDDLFGKDNLVSSGSDQMLRDVDALTEKGLAPMRAQFERGNGIIETFNQGAAVGKTRLEKLQYGLQNVGQSFQMAYLSVLFFGMVIQQTFMNIAKNGIGTFRELSDSTNQASQGFSVLEGAFKTIRYAIGDALGNAILPFIPAILNIVDAVLNFIDTHPGFVSWFILGGIAAGAFLVTLGQVVLGFSGLAEVGSKVVKTIRRLEKVKWANLGNKISAFNTKLKNFFSSTAGRIALGAIGAAVAVDFTIKAFNVLNNAGSTIGEYAGLVGRAALAGALIGAAFGGLPGAGIGAAIGAAVGTITVILDVVVESKIRGNEKVVQNIEASIQNSLDRGSMDYGQILNLAEIRASENPLGELGTMLNKVFSKSVEEEVEEILFDTTLTAEQQIKRLNEVLGSNFIVAPSADVSKIAKQQLDLEEAFQRGDIGAADYTAEFEKIRQRGEALSPMYSQLLANLRQEQQRKQQAAEATKQAAEAEKRATEAKEEANIYTRIQKNELVKLVELDPDLQEMANKFTVFNQKIQALDLTNLTALTDSVYTLQMSLLGGDNALADALINVILLIDGNETSMTSVMSVWIGKMHETSATIKDTLVPQLQSATSVLGENAGAARDAARAQRSYNKAVAGDY